MGKTKNPEDTPNREGVEEGGNDSASNTLISGVKKAKKSTGKAQKAGLVFPVAKVNRKLKDRKTVSRVGECAPVFISAVVEYLTTEILDLAGQICSKDGSRKRVSVKDVLLAIRRDKLLNKSMNGLRVLVGEKIEDASIHVLPTKEQEKKWDAKNARKQARDARRKEAAQARAESAAK